MNIGRTIKYIRFERKMIQSEVAKQIGISTNAYCSIEKGHSVPNAKTLHKICEVLTIDKAILYFYSLETCDSSRKESFKSVLPIIKSLIKQVYPELP